MNRALPTDTAVAETGPRRPNWARPAAIARTSISQFSLVYVGVLVFALFAILTPSTFLQGTTLKSILNEQSITALVSVGLLVPLSAGVFDLSVGYLVGLGGMLVGYLLAHGVAIVPAILITAAMGLVVGVFNGQLVIRARIDSFIATLGMGSILSAAIGWVSGGAQIIGLPNSFDNIALNEVGGVSLPVFYLLGISIIMWFVLNHTPVGRRIYATGGGREAAMLAGVRTQRIILCSFLVSGVLAALAGVLLSASLASASPSLGPNYLLPAFAAVFLGSTQITPGRFNVLGTLLAVYVLAMGVKGLQLLGAPVWTPDLFNGAALLVAVGLSLRNQALSLPRFARWRRRPGAGTSLGGGMTEAADPDPAPKSLGSDA
jgi:ribose transport system permease protein